MSDVIADVVLIRDRDGLRRLDGMDEWTGMTLLAVLSADPRSFEELAQAWLRYRPEESLTDLEWVLSAEPPGRNRSWILLDLACQRVSAGSGAKLPQNPETYQRDHGRWKPDNPLVWINYPPAWQSRAGLNWESAQLPLPDPHEPLDVRGILYGRPLMDAIAHRTLSIAREEVLPNIRLDWSDVPRGEPLSDAQRKTMNLWHQLTLRVHVDWLMTPRKDLESEPPRTFLHRDRAWVERELANREEQWSNEGRAPHPLATDTYAFRYGPFGRTEVVMYFDLCREVIRAAWDNIFAAPEIGKSELAKLLHEHAQAWLDSGMIDDDPTPPAVMIESERRRLPLVSDGSHLDCDCPICRMTADGSMGLMFRGFDGYHLDLDDEFAFSLSETREDWELMNHELGVFSAEMDARLQAGQAGDATGDANSEADSDSSAWRNSHVDPEMMRNAEPTSPLKLIGLAMRVAELVGDLKGGAGATRDLIDSLNRAFDAYRAANEDAPLTEVRTKELVEVLEKIAASHPPLTSKVADLESQLDERQRRLA